MDLFWEKWESSGDVREMYFCTHPSPRCSAGAAPLRTLARHEEECYCVTWTKTFLPLASLLWYIFPQQGLSSEMNFRLASSALKACHSQVMAGRKRPTGLVFLPCKEIIWMLPEDSRLHSAPRVCTKAPLNAFSSLVIFKAEPRSQHSPWRSGFSILPTPSIFG